MSRFRWSDLEVRKALELPLSESLDGVVYSGVSTDSRTTRYGELYVALEGERFDGHDFVEEALAVGAHGAVVSRLPEGDLAGHLYYVEDTLVALGRLARHRRSALPARVVGITGSTGKTGTKDLTAGALATRMGVHATPGNYNNRVGLPLTLLSAPADTDVVVAEMGSNEPGEISLLTAIARPDLGVVTTVGESHLEKLGSLRGVLEEKLALLAGLEPGAGAVVGDSPPELPEAARDVAPHVRVAGLSERADEDLRPTGVTVGDGGRHSFTWKGAEVSLSVPGLHAVENALLALTVSEMMGVPAGAAAQGVSRVEAGAMRGELRMIGDVTLILDCYNANPQSVAAALTLLETAPGRRIALLGSMLELGTESEPLHVRVLEEALARNIHAVVATGAFRAAAERMGSESGEGPEVIAIDDPLEAFEAVAPRLGKGDVVLLKGSRGVALERLVPLFERRFGAGEG